MQQTPTVDAPITYLFGALCGGGVLHVISHERSINAPALGEYFQRHQIDYFKVPPSFRLAWHAYRQRERVPPRRLLRVGGEASCSAWLSKVTAPAPDRRIAN